MISIKTTEEIELMRKSAKILADTLELVRAQIRPDIKTIELDRIAEEYIRDRKATPAFKGYRGFPKSVCTAVNEEVVHGIPGERILKNGDIISVDCGVIYLGWYSDAAITIAVGDPDKISKETKRFLKTVEQSLYNGIDQAKPGNRIGDISAAIQKTAEGEGYSVVRELTGHGIGRNLHEEPYIPNFGQRGTGQAIKPGMTFAIEVMINMGKPQVKTLADKWTIVTQDGSLSAQIEHTVLITQNGNEILTQKNT